MCNVSCHADAEAQDSNKEFAQQTLNSLIDERNSYLNLNFEVMGVILALYLR